MRSWRWRAVRASLGLEARLADGSHAAANVGVDGARERLGVAGANRADGTLVLIDEPGRAELAVHDAHERAELQPQRLDQAVERAAWLRVVDEKMEAEVALHVGVHVPGFQRLADRIVDR